MKFSRRHFIDQAAALSAGYGLASLASVGCKRREPTNANVLQADLGSQTPLTKLAFGSCNR